MGAPRGRYGEAGLNPLSDVVTETLKPSPTPAHFVPPPGAANCHAHVFGPPAAHQVEGKRRVLGTAEMYQRMLDVLHFDRGVLTQPSDFGFDNSRMLEVLAASPKTELAAIVVLPPAQLSDAELARLTALGVRGVRFPKTGEPRLDDLEAVAERIRGSGWHIELTPTDGLAPLVAMRSRFERLGVPVVLEQMGGCPDVRRGIEDAQFQAVLSMVRDGVVWVKLSHPYHLADYPYAEVLAFAQALVDANVKRCVFATDWPHPRAQEHHAVPDDGFLLDLFATWVPDEANRHAILVENPQALYRF